MTTQTSPAKVPKRKLFLILGGVLAGLCMIFLMVDAIGNSLNPASHVGATYTSAVQTVFANVTLDVAIKDNHGTETAMAHTLQTSIARQTVFANVTLDVAIKNNHGTETVMAASRSLQTSVATPTKTP